MPDKKTKAAATKTVVTSETSPATPATKFALPTIPTKIAFKRETLIKTGIIVLAILVAIPLLDWLIQTSISAKYAAFYKDNDITRDAYIDALEDQFGSNVIQRLLIHSIVINAGKEKGIVVSDAEVAASIEEKKKANGITTDAEFKAALQSVPGAFLTIKVYTQSIQVSMTLEKMLSGTVKEPTEAELKAFYEANKATQYGNKKYDEVKTSVLADAKAEALSTIENNWITAELEKYDGKNIIVDPANASYRFLRSIELVNRLFTGNPNTK